MKSLLLSGALILCSAFSTFATVRTVSNNPNSPGQYTNLQTCLNACANNDTVYVHGSATSYGTINLEKPITLIGAGALPNNDFKLATTLTDLNVKYNSTNSNSGSGSKIMGFAITGYLYLKTNTAVTAAVSNLVITRNKMQYLSFAGTLASIHNGIQVSNNVIVYIQGSAGINNSVLKNNLFYSIANLGHETAGSWIFENNVISQTLNSCRSGLISNNILMTANATPFTSNEYCTITKNCFFSTSTTLTQASIIYGTNSGSNNLINVDPLFIAWNHITNLNSTTYASYYNVDFNLDPASPCKNYGTDGTDLGIYGGSTPFVEGEAPKNPFRYFPMPAIPQVTQLNILNPSVPQAGTLNVQFKAAKRD